MEPQQKCCTCGLTLPGESTRSCCVLVFALGVTGASRCGRDRRSHSLIKELFVYPSLEGVSPVHYKNLPGTSCLLLGWGSVGGRGQILHLQPALSKGHCPSQYHLSEEFLIQYFLGLCNSSLNDLKCEIYQPSVIFSVIYSIWCDPPNFGVEIKLVEFTFHSFFLLYSPGTCLVFVF